MILQESEWYGDVIRRRIGRGALVLNIGSSTRHFVEVKQPYIKENVLDELAKKDCDVKNIDIKKADGVDMVGDIRDPLFAEELRALKPDAVICANTHEHIEDRQEFSRGLESLIDGDAVLIVSAPCAFPYHEDPIDTMYRTDLNGLSKEFPSLHMIEGKIVAASYLSVIAGGTDSVRKIWFLAKQAVKLILLAVTLRWKDAACTVWTFRRVYETCAVFARRPNV